MKNLIISFKSRNSIYAFSKILRSNGVNVSVINTPRGIAVSCGLSIKVEFRHLRLITNLIKQTSFDGFVGVFTESTQHPYKEYQRLL